MGRESGPAIMIPDELIERIRDEADIVQIIGEHVPLKRLGSDYRGPCPFHQGTHPNFSVSTKKRMYYCFVCHEGGDVFTFLSKRLGMDWPTAVRAVAERSGIEVPAADAHRPGPDPRERLWEVTASAADYFRRVLWEEDIGDVAREYLSSRGINRVTADRFGIGYAPPAIGLMRSYLQTLGFDDARQTEVGLLSAPEEGREPRPRFRGRLIFPIFDAAGHTVGFGGRLLGPGQVKYVNSPESVIFAKRRVLYGLNWAKLAIRRDERVLVVEGYFDVVRLMSAGIESVVAPLGTALTPEQAELIARHTKHAFVIYDSDRAGLKATFRSADELLRRGIAVNVVTLPEGEDPDTYVGAHGGERLLAHVSEAVDVLDRKIQLLQRQGWFRDVQHKRRAIDRLLPTIRAAADPILQDLYVSRASEAAGIPRALLWREVGVEAPSFDGEGSAMSPAAAVPIVPARPARRGDYRGVGSESGASAERELVRWVLLARSEMDRIGGRVSPTMLREPRLRAIYDALVRLGPDATVSELAGALDPDAIASLEELLAEGATGADPGRVVQDSIATLRVRELSERLAEIDRLVGLASDVEQRELMTEKQTIMREVRELRGRGFRRYGKSRQSVRRSDGAP
jgi:DNA primase